VCLSCLDSSKPLRRYLADAFVSSEADMGEKQMYQEEWQKREHLQNINNSERTGNEPLQNCNRGSAVIRATN
jgi:hypothetical protein